MSRGLALAAGLLVPCAALAQSFVIPVPTPKNIILPNYDNVLIGPVEAVEAGAYLARTQDATASFYNPAGIVAADTSLTCQRERVRLVPAEIGGPRPVHLSLSDRDHPRLLGDRRRPAALQDRCGAAGLLRQ
jgi:hypothetical protein